MKKWICRVSIVMGVCLGFLIMPKSDAGAQTIKQTVEASDGGKCTIWDIQEALDEAQRNSDDKYEIRVPRGVYRLEGSERLHLSSNTTLILTGVTFKRTKTSGAGAMIIVGYPRGEAGKSTSPGGGYTKGGYTRGHDIKIIGGTFDAGSEVRNVTTLCTFSHVKNITFEGTTFCYRPKSVNITHMMEFGASKNVTIKNCCFLGNQKMGEAVQIESALKKVASSDLMGKEDGTKTSNVRIQNCTFSNFEYAFGTNHGCSRDKYTHFYICGNTFEKITKYAICCYNYSGAVVKRNVIKKSGKKSFDSFILKLGQKNTLVQSGNKVQ